jgi:hypothetical protein
MKTKFHLVRLLCGLFALSLLISMSSGQDAAKEIKGMIKDALGRSDETVAINDSNQKLHLRLDKKRCVVNGASNTIRIDGECAELLVNGTGNSIRVEKVGGVRILGANNNVAYETGISGPRPEDVRVLGAGSSAVKSGGGEKNASAPTEPGRKGESAAAGEAVVISDNNNSHVTRSIADGSPLVLSGNNNSVEITGEASSLTVTGNNNEIRIDGVGRVIFKGNNNEVFFRKGETPKTTGSGLNNTVERQE